MLAHFSLESVCISSLLSLLRFWVLHSLEYLSHLKSHKGQFFLYMSPVSIQQYYMQIHILVGGQGHSSRFLAYELMYTCFQLVTVSGSICWELIWKLWHLFLSLSSSSSKPWSKALKECKI